VAGRDPSQIAPLLSGGPTAAIARALRLNRAVDPAAEAVRRAKMLLFAPQALEGRQSAAPKPTKARKRSKQAAPKAGIIPTNLTQTLR
jgi:hypothetical protein